MKSQISLFEEISQIIGEVSSDLIEKIVNISNEKKILYHGIKRNIELVTKEGVKPLTPDSEYCSFWATGVALFDNPYDSPFFRYSGGYSDKLNCTNLNLVITTYDLLAKNDIQLSDYKKDSRIKIKETISPNDISILTVNVKQSNTNLRESRQIAERILLKNISSQISDELSLGQVIKEVSY